MSAGYSVSNAWFTSTRVAARGENGSSGATAPLRRLADPAATAAATVAVAGGGAVGLGDRARTLTPG